MIHSAAPIRFILIALVFILALWAPGLSLRAQDWNPDYRAWYSFVDQFRVFGMSRRVVLDTCTKDVWAVLGGRIWRSGDSGSTWTHMPIPNLQDYRPVSQLVVAGCNIIYHWEDKVGNDEFRMFSYDRTKDHWRELRPLGAEGVVPRSPKVGLSDSVVILVGLRASYEDLYLSTNLGKDWDSTIIPRGFNSNVAEHLVEIKKGVFSVARDSAIIEYDTKASSFHVVNLPGSPIAYRFFDSATIIAAVVKTALNGTTFGVLARSNDTGGSWIEIDSLVFVNSNKVLRGKFLELTALLMRQQADIITVVMTTGDVVSTKNGGIDWFYRGNVGVLDIAYAAEALYTDYAGRIVITNGGLLCLLPTDLSAIDTLTRSAPSLYSTIRIDSCTFIGIGPRSLFRSIDCGKTWHLPTAPADLFGKMDARSQGTHLMNVGRVTADEAGINLISSEHSALYRLNRSEAATYKRQSPGYPQFYVFNEISPEYVDRGGPTVQLIGDTTYSHSTHISVQGPNTRIRKPIGAGSVRASALSIASGSEWIAVSDSVYFSSNRAESWTSAKSAGLPRDAKGRIQEASQIVRLSPTTLLMGLRGLYSDDGTDTTIRRPGGLYRSDDNGDTWISSDEGLGKQSYIWYITTLDENTVLCAAGQVLADTNNTGSSESDRYTQSGATIMRSTDAGRTWTMVHNEPRSRPAYWGRRELLSTSPSRVLYASMEDGVMESTDAGESWHTIGETPLYFRFIDDIDVDKSGTIYAATHKGLYTFTPTTINVENEEDQGRFASVWAYPTPVNGQLTIRINNAHLTKGKPKLSLMNIYGQQISDLSSLITQTPARQEFTVSVESLAPGIYLLSMSHAGGSEWCKVMVQK